MIQISVYIILLVMWARTFCVLAKMLSFNLCTFNLLVHYCVAVALLFAMSQFHKNMALA